MNKYNELALYSLNIPLNTGYPFKFALTCGLIVFLTYFIYESYFEKELDSFSLTFIITLLYSIASALIGLILSAIWSLVLLYVLPLVLFTYLLFKGKDIWQFISEKTLQYKIKPNKKEVLSITEELKCKELAKQVYENLKKDIPNVSYEDVLNNIKKNRNFKI